MARLDTSLSRPSPQRQIPWKVLTLVACIGAIWAFIAYKYVQYRVPTRTLSVQPAEAASLKGRAEALKLPAQRPNQWLQIVKELDLSEDQKNKIEKIAAETTVPKTLRARVNKVLTPQQRERLTSRVKELAAQRAEQQKARANREQKYYGTEIQYAQQANQVIRQQREARRRMALQTSQTSQPLVR
ncbi:MAG: hypothetical protein N2Z21_00765 [Candidatus Sumerlaeaceae bacterium]|nr:hypothetical protein [Candidatus Sumerlaeaceae bacterium]